MTLEQTLEPDLAIIDAHHHFMRALPPIPGSAPGRSQYLFDDFLEDATSGHRVVGSVVVGGMGAQGTSGPDHLRGVGDTTALAALLNESAVREAAARHGLRAGAALVATIDLRRPVHQLVDALEQHAAAGDSRLRGVRHMTVHGDQPMLMPPGENAAPDLAFHADFRAGFARLAEHGLSFDAWCYFTQLDGIVGLARDFPDTTIVVNHCGGPLGIGSWAPRFDEAFSAWRVAVTELADYPNVAMKLGGLGMWTTGLPSTTASPKAPSAQIAREQQPYLDICIEAFGPDRCMFESNYPIEAGVGSYHAVWNAFKRATTGYTPTERSAMFSGTAARVYRIDAIPLSPQTSDTGARTTYERSIHA